MLNKNQHGGPDRGQGRKPKPPGEKFIRYPIYLPPSLVLWLKRNIEEGKRSEFIRKAINKSAQEIDDLGEKNVTETH